MNILFFSNQPSLEVPAALSFTSFPIYSKPQVPPQPLHSQQITSPISLPHISYMTSLKFTSKYFYFHFKALPSSALDSENGFTSLKLILLTHLPSCLFWNICSSIFYCKTFSMNSIQTCSLFVPSPPCNLLPTVFTTAPTLSLSLLLFRYGSLVGCNCHLAATPAGLLATIPYRECDTTYLFLSFFPPLTCISTPPLILFLLFYCYLRFILFSLTVNGSITMVLTEVLFFP